MWIPAALITVLLLILPFSTEMAGDPNRLSLARHEFGRGLTLFRNKQYRKALTRYLEALRLDPTNWRYLHTTGRLYRHQLKQPEKAIPYFTRAAKVEKKSAWSLLELGGIHYSAKRYKTALGIHEKIFAICRQLKKDPPYWASHMTALILVYKLDRPREALPYIRPLLDRKRKTTTRAAGREWLGRIEYRLLHFRQAFDHYGQAAAMLETHLRTKPADADARWKLAHLYYTKLKQIRSSNRHIRILLKRHSGHKNASLWKQWLVNHSPRTAEITFTYHSRFGINPDYFFLLPLDNAQQRHLFVRFDPVPLSMRLFRRYGNRWAFLRYRNPAIIRNRKTIKVRLKIRMIPTSIHQGDRFTADRDEDPKFFLDWEHRYDPEYARRARQIIGNETDRLRKAWLIHEWLSRNFTYKIIGFSTGNEHLRKQLGECGTWAATSVALMQAAGIPARFLGMHIAKKEGGQLGTHIGSEFYHPKYGWVPVDNTGQMFGYIHNRVHPWHSNPRGIRMPHYTPLWASNTIRWLR